MESAEENVLPTPEQELDEEHVFTNPSSLNLSEAKQKEVLMKYIQVRKLPLNGDSILLHCDSFA